MAHLSGLKLDSESGRFISNCFPVRGLVKRDINEGDGAWLVAHRAEQRRRFKAILCAKPRTYSRIREERKRAEQQGVPLTATNIDNEDEDPLEAPVLDGYFLLKHCCVEDPSDLCSINIAGQELSECKEEDFEIFDNVAYINAGENFLPFEAFRGFPSLRELEMPLNGLRNLKSNVPDFPNLEVLDLSYNNLSQEDILTVGMLPRLRVLHLTGNNFKTLPPDMSMPYVSPEKKVRRRRFAQLEVLLVDDNKFSDINVFAALAGLPKLRHINMEKNEVFCIPQLKCVEGRVVTHEGTKPDKPPRSGRRSKSRQGSARGSVGSVKSARSASGTPTQEELQIAENSQTSASVAEVTEETNEPTEKPKSDEFDFGGNHGGKLMNDDFSLGELGERITELEEETAKGNESLTEEGKANGGNEEPKAFPPFPELRYLNLAHNQIHEEDALLAVAAWPMLVHLVIHGNPLTTHHAGDPPLLKRFLSDRLGINLQRKEKPLLVKPNIDVPQTKSRTVSDIVPKVPRSTVEERLQQLALEAPRATPAIEQQPSQSWFEDRTLSGLDLETSKRMPLPPIPATPPVVPPTPRTTQAWGEREKSSSSQTWVEREKSTSQVWMEREKSKTRELIEEGKVGGERPHSGTFFMTQVDDQAAEDMKKAEAKLEEKQSSNANVNNSSDNRYRGYELLLEDDDDVQLEVDLPKDIQGNVRALKHALGHTLVYRDARVDLDHIKRTVPEYRRAPQPPPMPHKPRQERIDELLVNLKTRSTTEEEKLASILKHPTILHKKFPEARALLGQVQRRYNAVRRHDNVLRINRVCTKTPETNIFKHVDAYILGRLQCHKVWKDYVPSEEKVGKKEEKKKQVSKAYKKLANKKPSKLQILLGKF